MSGFLSKSLNHDFQKGLYKVIIEALIECSNLMKEDCIANKTRIANHEEKIRNHLLENYLENDDVRLRTGLSGIAVRFMPEAPESYSSDTDTYSGRADIKVVSTNWLFGNNRDYYTVECKRIDGSGTLNELYISEGICRFVIFPPKYSSFHNRNIMFGFVVKSVDIKSNALDISKLHHDKLHSIINKDIDILVNDGDKNFCLCESVYMIEDRRLELGHIFYDFSAIICSNS